MAMMHNQETESWSGEGVGTTAESFLARINREVRMPRSKRRTR